MGRLLYQKVQQIHHLKLQAHDMPCLKGVGGNPVPKSGCAEVEVGIAAEVCKTPEVVSARKESPILLLGLISYPPTTVTCHSETLYCEVRQCSMPSRKGKSQSCQIKIATTGRTASILKGLGQL